MPVSQKVVRECFPFLTGEQSTSQEAVSGMSNLTPEFNQ